MAGKDIESLIKIINIGVSFGVGHHPVRSVRARGPLKKPKPMPKPKYL